MRSPVLVVLAMVWSCGADDPSATTTGRVAEGCVPSTWAGVVQTQSDMLSMSACLGDECSGDIEVPVLNGTSCVLGSHGEHVGQTEPPDPTPLSDGQVMSTLAMSSSGETAFLLCALRYEGVDSGPGEIYVEVVVNGRYPGGDEGVPARLVVEGDENVVVDSAMTVPAPGNGSDCANFEVDLQGSPI